jgi:hypothetical protein
MPEVRPIGHLMKRFIKIVVIVRGSHKLRANRNIADPALRGRFREMD